MFSSDNKMQDNGPFELEIQALVPELRHILQKKHRIENPSLCDDFLARCLRIKDGNVKAAAQLVLVFKSVTAEIGTWNVSIQPSHYEKSFYDNHTIFPLKTRDSMNRRLYVVQTSKWDPDKLGSAEMFVAGSMLLQYAVSRSVTDQRNGFVLIWDYSGLSCKQICAIGHAKMVIMATCTQKGMVGKLKAFHVMNQPKVFNVVYSIIKPFVSQKMKKRIFFHHGPDSLHESICLRSESLPTFLGGQLEIDECIDQQLLQDLMKSDEFFLDMFRHGFPQI